MNFFTHVKRSLPILFVSLLLASCGSRTAAPEAVCQNRYWDGTVGTCLPGGWSPVTSETLRSRGVTEGVVVAFQKDKAESGQFPTVTVTKEQLPEGITSTAYSAASIRSVSTYPSYKVFSTRTMKVDGSDVTLHVFSAQPLEGDPARRFYQVSAVGPPHTGYTFTALTPLSVSDALEKEILVIMNNVTFVEQSSSSAASK